MTSPLYQLEGVRFSIAGRVILCGIDLVLQPGRVYGVIGPNGSGKSTLVKLLARQARPSGGSIRFAGTRLEDWADRMLARQVAYMPQFTPPSDGMNVRELVSLGRFPWHGTLGRFTADDRAKVDAAIDRTGLEDLADRIVDTLSGGERQRAWLAMALAQDTRCILLDEPTSALDVANEVNVLKLLRDISRERDVAIVVILHDINLAARICDDLIALRSGGMVAHGPPGELMEPEVLGRIYGVPMGILSHPGSGAPIGYVL